MQGYIIGISQRVLELDILDPGLLFLNTPRMAQVHQLLNPLDKFVILIRRVIAKNIHVESGTFFDHRQADAPRSNDGDGFARNLVAEKWQEWMPRRPFLFAHESLALPHFSREHAQD